MLSPPIVRAGVARQKSVSSPLPPNRRSASSSSRIAPLQLPPISSSAAHSRSGSRIGAPYTPHLDELQPPPATFTSTLDTYIPSSHLAATSFSSDGALIASPPTKPVPFAAQTMPPSFDPPSPSAASTSSTSPTTHVPTGQHVWWLTFNSAYHEGQFQLFMRTQTDARLASAIFVALYAGAIATNAAHYDDDRRLMLQRLLLLLASLVMTAVMLVWCRVYRCYETSRQLVVLAIGVCASSLWILAFAIHAAALAQVCQPAALILFNSLWLSGCRPLLLPYAMVQLLVSCSLFTIVICVDPSSNDTPPQLFFAAFCVCLHGVVLPVYLRRADAASRSHYCHTVSLHFLHQHNAQLTSDTRQLKSDFFVLTLERFDIADVEEEGKLLSSAMEQAMGKLQALGKNQLLPPAVLKEIMAVISLLGSGSDLFKAKMEHNSLAGEDDEMTRYIYETLNGEHNRTTHTPTQRSLTYAPKTNPTSSDLTTVTEGGGVGGVMSVGMEVASELDRSLSGLLAQLEDWNLDLFEVSNMTGGRPLYFIGMALLKRYNCLVDFELDAVKLSNYLREMEAGYGTNNPYHNSIHAADVARSVHYFIECGRLTHYCSKLDLFTLIIASLAHDFQHPGKNNAYLISVRDERALIYNDRSVLENFHTAQTFHLLLNSQPSLNCNFLSHLPLKDYLTFRKMMVELVLATDLAHSNEFLGRFKNWYVNASGSAGSTAGSSSPATAISSPTTATGGTVTVDGVLNVAGSPLASSSLVFQSTSVSVLDSEARLMVMKMALKCADIGHSAKRLQLHEKWAARITEEFYRQGDEERKQCLAISPFMDRRKANLSQSQTGFIDYVCQPLYGAWFKFLDPDERRQREMHDDRLRLLRGEWERAASDGTGGGGGGRGSASGGGGSGGGGEGGSDFEWVRKRTASQMRLDEELVSVLEQLRRNREHWKTWQGPSRGMD